ALVAYSTQATASRPYRCPPCPFLPSLRRAPASTLFPYTTLFRSQHHRPALLERALDRRVHTDEDVARLLEEPEQRRVARLLLFLGKSVARLEARVVDRRHELAREERAHRLADEVRRRDARDPEPVRDLGRDGRLAGARRAADEDDHRQVELAQILVAS